LLAQKPDVRAYIGAEVKPLLITEDVWAAHLWSGDTFQAQDPEVGGNENIEYVIPASGAELWVDGMVLLADAPNPATAHLWMNFTMRAEVSAQISNYVYYASPNDAALPLLDEDLRDNPSVFPDTETRSRLEFKLERTPEIRSLMDDIALDVKS
jgi:putrescine transport system substrate-binding protein